MSRKILYFMKIIIVYYLMALFSVAFSEEKSQQFCKVENVFISYEYYGNDKGETKLKIKNYGAYVLREDNRVMTSIGEPPWGPPPPELNVIDSSPTISPTLFRHFPANSTELISR